VNGRNEKDYISKVLDVLKDPEQRARIDAVVSAWAAIDAQPLEFVPLGDGWLARRAGFAGTGATKRAAHEDLDRVIWLHFAPPGTEWVWNGQGPPGLRDGKDELE
jgi:hypothetical protein